MYIDENVMEEYLSDNEKFKALCKQKGEINERFGFTQEVFESMQNFNNKVLYMDKFPKAQWSDGECSCDENEPIKRQIFAPSQIDLTEQKGYFGIEYQAKYFSVIENGLEKKVRDCLSMIGGFQEGRAKDEYRILSNARTSKDDFNNTLQSNGKFAWINSHFADNTLFIEFINFIRTSKEDKVGEYDNIALHYPDDDKNLDNEAERQRNILAYRFPLKFLWMWANKGSVIHPLSLMAFREFLKSEFTSEIFKDLSKKNFSGLNYDDSKKMGTDFSKYAEQITNAKIEYFPEIWNKVSEAIMNKLGEVCKEGQSTEKVSQLISLLTLGETDMTNIDELLKTHKQIILYGVPGTGKTHSAKELIKNKIKQDWDDNKDKMKDYQFGAILNNKSDLFTFNAEKEIQPKEKGIGGEAIWDIMQFHPNTTYQDFIGGIIPKIGEKNESLIYEVESGKFKKFCEYASKNEDKKFVFIIDEINRANLSEVLGELLYALEYRDEGITIPNFNEPFVIPSNVYIIGTMNNVDKSLATFDLALRRRFGFYEIGVDCDVIGEILESKEIENLNAYIGRCQDLNALVSGEIEEEDRERLKNEEKLNLEKHYKIGQAYFAKIEKFLQKGEAINPNHLRKLWDYHLQPLIEEYIGFSMNDKEISNKLKRLKDFWTKKLPEESE